MSKAEVVLFHSVLGLRPSVIWWADQLRAAGHTVHTPDLYGGVTFDGMADAAKSETLRAIGFEGVLARATESVAGLPPDVVYAGFSNGGMCAELLAATRHGARGAVLMDAPLQVRALGWSAWPAGVPVQVHFGQKDPMRSQQVIDDLAGAVRASGATFTEYVYPEARHLFADAGLPQFRDAEARQMLQRVVEFLDSIGDRS